MDDADDDLLAALGFIDAPRAPDPLDPASFDPAAILTIADPRARFDALKHVCDTLNRSFSDFRERLRSEYESAMRKSWRQYYGTAIFHLSAAESRLAPIAQERVAVARAKIEAYRFGRDRAVVLCHDAMRAACREFTIAKGEERSIYEIVYEANYSTQTRPHTYAEVRASIYAAHVRALGLVPDVIYDSDLCAHYVYASGYAASDEPYLHWAPGIGLPEMVRLAWARGVNPRVYWSDLPPDFELTHGIAQLGGSRQTSDAKPPDPGDDDLPPGVVQLHSPEPIDPC